MTTMLLALLVCAVALVFWWRAVARRWRVNSDRWREISTTRLEIISRLERTNREQKALIERLIDIYSQRTGVDIRAMAKTIGEAEDQLDQIVQQRKTQSNQGAQL